MRGIESMLDAVEPGMAVSYGELAQWVYGVDEPTRAQLSAIGRAVGRLVERRADVHREEVVAYTGEDWEKPTPTSPGRAHWRPPARRGPVIVRQTRVWRGTKRTTFDDVGSRWW
jgi:hypothetical protein